MSIRQSTKQSEHDAAISAAKQIYENKGKYVWTNPGSQKNKTWNGRYIDVIAAESAEATRAWVIEVETDDSVSESEARDQWQDYDEVYQGRWYLVVPRDSKEKAEQLMKKHGISHCRVITWTRNPNGLHSFWGLPGL
ncbi:MAG: hypothetical protein OXN21_12285 [Chloroflexota bacterium]|nr:hypothetical protein [Chloroflexota bacterium]